MDDNIIDIEKEFQIKKLTEDNKRLVNEITKLKILLKDLDPEADVSDVSDEEAICIEQIQRIKKYSSNRDLTPDEIKGLDVLVKNLRLIRGQSSRDTSDKLTKKTSKEELEKIIKGE